MKKLKQSKKSLLAAMLAVGVPIVMVGSAQAAGILSNGTIAIGVQDSGALNVPHAGASVYGPAFDLSETGTVSGTGVRGIFLNDSDGDGQFGGYESTYPGCLCEGWGVAVASLGITGYDGNGSSNLSGGTGTFGTDGSGYGIATTVRTIADSSGNPVLRVTHDFRPSASEYLYQVDVTIENISGVDLGSGSTDLRYTRLMDWDTEPTAFSEYVTIERGGATNLLTTSDDGFEPADPLFSTTSIASCAPVGASFVDCGPRDHGARFDFGFPALLGMDDPATTGDDTMRSFTIFYGAAPDEATADAARAIVGAGVYSYGQCNSALDPTCSQATGTPLTYIFAFESTGVGAPPPPTGGVPEPSSLLLMALGLGVFTGRRWKPQTI